MKILVISDNHGDQEILNSIKAQMTADAIFHCGDSEGSPTDSFFDGTSYVRGNNDFATGFPEEVSRKVGKLTVYMTHGDKYGVNFDLNRLALRAAEVDADIVLFGHTHKLGVEWQNNRLFVNPGSILLPRGEYSRIGGTFAMITVTDTNFEVDFYNRACQKVPELKTIIKR